MTETTTAPETRRIHYLDAVRALAMLLGVFFHAALAYGVGVQGVWFVGDMNASSVGLEAFAWFSHLFRMAVFFLLAGFFAHLLVERRGIRGFVRNRLIRIVLPFVLFLPVISTLLFFLVGWAIEAIAVRPPILELILEAAEAGAAPPPPTTGHLWFLLYLGYFGAATAVLARVTVPGLGLADRFFGSTIHLVWAPILLVPALYSSLVPLPAPERFLPELFAVAFYGPFYLAGWHFYRYPRYLDQVERHLVPLSAAAVVGTIAFWIRLPLEPVTLEVLRQFADGPPQPAGWWHLLDATLEAYLAVYLTLIALVLGRRWLHAESRAMRYISDASYWVYVVHIPLLFYIQVHLSHLDLNAWVKFAIASLGTSAIAFLSYEIGVRYTPIGTMLNGKKRRSGRVAGGATAKA